MIRSPSDKLGELTAEFLNGLSANRIGIETDSLVLSTFRELEAACEAKELVATSGAVERLRAIKDADEIERTRRGDRYRPALHEVDDPDAEWRLDGEGKSHTSWNRECGSWVPRDAVLIRSSRRERAGALPHYHPHAVRLEATPTLLIDWGANYQGYASDLTRTFHQNSASDDFRRAYDLVLESQLAAIDAIGPGVVAGEVDKAARNVLKQGGMADAFKHSPRSRNGP